MLRLHSRKHRYTGNPLAGNYGYGEIKYTPWNYLRDGSCPIRKDTTSERVGLNSSIKRHLYKIIIAKLKPIKNHRQIFTSLMQRIYQSARQTLRIHIPFIVFIHLYRQSELQCICSNCMKMIKYKKKPSGVFNRQADITITMLYLFSPSSIKPASSG